MPKIFVTKEEYLVEKVLEHRWSRKRLYFKVKWAGYVEPTWEPHCLLYNNESYQKYRRSLPWEVRVKIQIPEGVEVGDDDDGLCVRRAVQKLKLRHVDANKFTPWMTVAAVLAELRAQNCYVRELRRGEETRGKRLLLINGLHAEGVRCGRRRKDKYRAPTRRNHLVFLVAKRKGKVTRAKEISTSTVPPPEREP